MFDKNTMFHLPDKEEKKKKGRQQERERMNRKTRERKNKTKQKSWKIETSQRKRVQKTIIQI